MVFGCDGSDTARARTREGLRAGLACFGPAGRFAARAAGGGLRANVVPDGAWRALLAAGTLEAQRRAYETEIEGEGFRAAVAVLLSRTTHLAFYPEAMFAQAEERDFARFFLAQFRDEVARRSLAGNYFLTQFLFGEYDDAHPEGAPPYLPPGGYDEARRNAGELAVVPAPLESFEAGAVDAFFLSNVFDWAGPGARARIGAAVLRAAAPGAALLFRNLLAAPPLPEALRGRLAIDVAASAALLEAERSMLYRSVTFGTLSP